MNLPFNLPAIKEVTLRKKDESAEARDLYEQRLAMYRETLENYKNCILEHSKMLDSYEKRSLDNQLSIVQTALDITYIKEQGEKTVELLNDMNEGSMSKTLSSLEGLLTAIINTNDKLDGIDKNVVNRLSDLLLELQKQTVSQNTQLQTELANGIEKLNRNIRKNHTMLWLIFVLNFVGLNVLVFIALYFFRGAIGF